MYIINANITYNKPVGELSDNRIQQLKEELLDFPEITVQPNNVIFKNGNKAIIVNPAQITYAANLGAEPINIEEIADYLNKINNKLGLSSQANIALTLEGLIEFGKSSFGLSLNHFQEEARILSAIGIGYRFMVDTGDFAGDIRIEPFLRDDNKIYAQSLLQNKTAIDINQAKNIVQKMYVIGTERVEEVLNKLFQEREA